LPPASSFDAEGNKQIVICRLQIERTIWVDVTGDVQGDTIRVSSLKLL
jgi:hypothetical protein